MYRLHFSKLYHPQYVLETFMYVIERTKVDNAHISGLLRFVLIIGAIVFGYYYFRSVFGSNDHPFKTIQYNTK